MILRLYPIMESARTVSCEAFEREHPEPVLLLPLLDGDSSRTKTHVLLVKREGGRPRFVPYDVAPIRKRPHSNLFKNLITIGRAPNNDIEVKSSEVSKFHAFFMIDPFSGQVRITDAGSTNGTRIDGRALKPKEEAGDLSGGETLAFGSLEVVFHTPITLWRYLRDFDAGQA
jgi:hypothetical protein